MRGNQKGQVVSVYIVIVYVFLLFKQKGFQGENTTGEEKSIH